MEPFVCFCRNDFGEDVGGGDGNNNNNNNNNAIF
jgi:hypothetical protein